MSDVVRRLVTVLGFESETDKAKDYDKVLKGLRS